MQSIVNILLEGGRSHKVVVTAIAAALVAPELELPNDNEVSCIARAIRYEFSKAFGSRLASVSLDMGSELFKIGIDLESTPTHAPIIRGKSTAPVARSESCISYDEDGGYFTCCTTFVQQGEQGAWYIADYSGKKSDVEKEANLTGHTMAACLLKALAGAPIPYDPFDL